MKNKFFKKTISMFLLAILMLNFLIPNFVYASKTAEEFGGALFAPIKVLVCAISDSVLNGLQNTFVTYETDIETDGVYKIRYSPGIIFQGDVPGLDINFIEPVDDQFKLHYSSQWEPVVKVTHANQKSAWTDFKKKVKAQLGGYLPEEIDRYSGDEEGLGPYNKIKFSYNGKDYKVKAWRSKWYTLVAGIWEHFWLMEETPNDPTAYLVDIKKLVDFSKYVINWENLGELATQSQTQAFTLVNKNNETIHFALVVGLRGDAGTNFIQIQYMLMVKENGEWKTIIDTATSHATSDTIWANVLPLISLLWTYQDDADKVEEINVALTDYMNKHGGLSESTSTQENKKNYSIAAKLKPTVSKWYKGTRLVAMVGLLSVILYVGIRIIISSTAADKAKYKKMLMDWLTALVMLFILHYIMAFILTISKQITNIFIIPDSSMDKYDPLISQIRQLAAQDALGDPSTVFFATVMYTSLVILTVIFTFQYLRRVLYMAFLTMIAPLICLTYPLDKIKDGQAQAFSMWIREYIFNALIQPVHLLIYTMLVGSAVDLVSISPIYAVVAISFIVPAEKFIRKMFGFEKASTVGQLGAAAGGAMIMNMINKAKHLGGSSKSSAGGSKGGQTGGSKPVRTATLPPSGAPSGEDGAGAGGMGPGGTGSGGTGPSGAGPSGAGSGGTGLSGASGSGLAMRSTAGMNARRIGGAISAIGHRYKLWGSGAGRQWIRRTGSIVGAGTLGTIGLAAGVATGDLENALKYGGAGLAAGNALGAGLGNMAGNLTDGVSGFVGTAKEGYLGEEEYANQQFDKQFYKSSGYQDLSRKYKDRAALREYTQAMLDGGITDAKKMDKAISSGLSAADAVTYNRMAKICPDNIKGDITKFREWYMHNIPDARADDVDRMYNNMKIFS